MIHDPPCVTALLPFFDQGTQTISTPDVTSELTSEIIAKKGQCQSVSIKLIRGTF